MKKTYTQRELDIEVKHAIMQALSHFKAEFRQLANEASDNVISSKDLYAGYEELGRQKAFNKAANMLAEKELEVLKNDLS